MNTKKLEIIINEENTDLLYYLYRVLNDLSINYNISYRTIDEEK